MVPNDGECLSATSANYLQPQSDDGSVYFMAWCEPVAIKANGLRHGRRLFNCFVFRVLVLCELAHCHTARMRLHAALGSLGLFAA